MVHKNQPHRIQNITELIALFAGFIWQQNDSIFAKGCHSYDRLFSLPLFFGHNPDVQVMSANNYSKPQKRWSFKH